MGSEKQEEPVMIDEREEEERATQDMWKYIFGFTEMAVLKCAVELGIPDALETHGGAMTVQELTSALDCKNSSALARVMRFLCNRGIFRSPPSEEKTTPRYQQTALSRRFRRSGAGDSMAALLLLESSPVMLAPWLALSASILAGASNNNPNDIQKKMSGKTPFEAVHGKDIWGYAAEDEAHSGLINDAMACDARATVGAIAEECLEEVFGGVGSVVDVGGGTGTAMGVLVKACPRIRAINFDLPHVVAVAEDFNGVDHVAGDMFVSVPNADAAFLMWVLHDWSDDECIQILKRCREAIPKDKGKVIIVEAVIDNSQKKEDNGDNHNHNNNENNNHDKLKDVGLFLDMVMLAHTTTGKERTLEEWTCVLSEAGFSRPTVRSIAAVQSVIEAFPA